MPPCRPLCILLHRTIGLLFVRIWIPASALSETIKQLFRIRVPFIYLTLESAVDRMNIFIDKLENLQIEKTELFPLEKEKLACLTWWTQYILTQQSFSGSQIQPFERHLTTMLSTVIQFKKSYNFCAILLHCKWVKRSCFMCKKWKLLWHFTILYGILSHVYVLHVVVDLSYLYYRHVREALTVNVIAFYQSSSLTKHVNTWTQ